jgi:hypothetical protein
MGYIALGVLALVAGLTAVLLRSDGPKPVYFICNPVPIRTQSSGPTPAAAVHAFLRERGADSEEWQQSSGSSSEAEFGRLVAATARVSDLEGLSVMKRSDGRWRVASRCEGAGFSPGDW